MIHASQANATQPLQRGKHDDAHISKHEGTSYQRLHRAEWFLAAESEPPVGAHVVTQRRGYTHHGIYVGASQVVHYAGLARGLRRGPVEEISLSSFAARHAVGVIAGVPQKFDAREVVRRARSRLGENRYRLLTNNCEHFCEWCLQGERRSYQIEACLELPSRALRATERLTISIGECVSVFGKCVLNWGSRTFRVETGGFSRAHRALEYIERNFGSKMRLRALSHGIYRGAKRGARQAYGRVDAEEADGHCPGMRILGPVAFDQILSPRRRHEPWGLASHID
jgi:hypothetical protein